MIELLRAERKRKGLATQEVAKLAKLREGVIIKAEKGGVIPSSREFRAWARSLGISWEQLWAMTFPPVLSEAN